MLRRGLLGILRGEIGIKKGVVGVGTWRWMCMFGCRDF